MAYSFDRSGYLLANGSANSLPDGDWSVGGWTHIDNAGDSAPVLLGQDSSDAAWYALTYYETGYHVATLRYRLSVSICDDAGLTSQLDSLQRYLSVWCWRHLLVQRSANVIRLYVDGTADANTATAHGAVTIAANNVFGRLGNLRLAEWAQWNRALDAAEILALAKGFSPQFLRRARQWYLPMVRGLEELDGSLSLSWSDVAAAAHPSILRPFAASTSTASDLPAGWTPPYRAVEGTVWHTGAVAGRACS